MIHISHGVNVWLKALIESKIASAKLKNWNIDDLNNSSNNPAVLMWRDFSFDFHLTH